MRSVWKATAVSAILIAGMAPCEVLANPELPANYDARSVGMAGTGTAFLEGATGGIYLNPALLDGVRKVDAALTISPMVPFLSAPLAQPGTGANAKQVDSQTSMIPFGFAGVGVRVHERIAVGLGAYVASGIGGNYQNVDALNVAATPSAQQDHFNDMKLQVAVFEASLPVSVRITDKLSIGASWRTSYTSQSTTLVVPNPAGPGLVNRVDQSLSGYSLLGGSLGVRFRLNKMVALGLSYRSKMKMHLDGKTDIDANATPPMVPSALATNASTTSQWNTPHQIRLGSAISLLNERLLLAVEGRVQFYHDANKTLDSTVDLEGQPLAAVAMTDQLKNSTKLAWKNAYTAQVGAEYWVIPLLALRAGFTLGNSASNARYASAFAPPPGLMYSFTAGLGLKWTHWEAGLAGSVVRGSSHVKAGDIASGPDGSPVATPGTYEGTIVLVALSAGFRI